MLAKRTVPFAVLGLAMLVSGCSALMPTQSEAVIDTSDQVVELPLDEIDRILTQLRAKAANDPSPQNLSQLKRMLSIRKANERRIELEALASIDTKLHRVSREPTMDWENQTRGGAAVRQAAYVHTLGGTHHTRAPVQVKGTSFKQAKPPRRMVEQALNASINFGNPDKEVSYSIYEMSRWERFCRDNGKDMDRLDWDFVKKQGANNLPEHLRANCNPPKKVR